MCLPFGLVQWIVLFSVFFLSAQGTYFCVIIAKKWGFFNNGVDFFALLLPQSTSVISGQHLYSILVADIFQVCRSGDGGGSPVFQLFSRPFLWAVNLFITFPLSRHKSLKIASKGCRGASYWIYGTCSRAALSHLLAEKLLLPGKGWKETDYLATFYCQWSIFAMSNLILLLLIDATTAAATAAFLLKSTTFCRRQRGLKIYAYITLIIMSFW